MKEKVKWYGVVSGCVFLVVSTYLDVKIVFEDNRIAILLLLTSIISALSTLVFGLMSLPRWQSFFAIAVFGYALYWFTQPAHGIPQVGTLRLITNDIK
jgi:hypothetical protein